MTLNSLIPSGLGAVLGLTTESNEPSRTMSIYAEQENIEHCPPQLDLVISFASATRVKVAH